MMAELARDWPGYGWETNRGYGTPEHYRGLQALGVTPLHRRSFAPVREIIERGQQPELAFSEIGTSESFAPHPPVMESGPPPETQHMVVEPLPPIQL
jgi:ribonuclease HII